MEIDIESFVRSYLATASWVECESGENQNFNPAGIKIATQDCQEFIERVLLIFGEELGTKLLTVEGTDVNNRTSHDFYLTRNRHGAGFWDNPEKYFGQENADKLTEIAEDMGESQAYHVSGRKTNRLTF